MNTEKEVETFLKTHDIEFIPTFVSKVQGLNHLQYKTHWTVEFKRGSRSLKTSYQAGFGLLLPKSAIPKAGDNSLRTWNTVRQLCETGHTTLGVGKYMKVDNPKPADVLSCLMLDFSVLDYSNFEEFATEFGYDPDSRSAEQTYKDCIETGLQYNRFFSTEEREELATLLADY